MMRTAPVREVGGERGDFGISARACPVRFGLSTPKRPELPMIPRDTHLQIGSLVFEGVDQIDLTAPFEPLSRIPNSTYRIYRKSAETVRDLSGFRLTPDAALAAAPTLNGPQGPGRVRQEPLLH